MLMPGNLDVCAALKSPLTFSEINVVYCPLSTLLGAAIDVYHPSLRKRINEMQP